jgi:8-oxo-dGTP pyrophosphatase MutT (NUDIX family)
MSSNPPDPLQIWEVLKSQYALRTKWLDVRQDTCRLPDGSMIDDYFVIERPEIVGIVAITPDNQVVFNRQYKHGLGEVVLETPAGMVDAGEDPQTAARRELEEESGYIAHELIPLGVLPASPTSQNNLYFVYLARNVKAGGKKVQHPRETIVNELIPLDQIPEKLRSGEINVLWSVAPLYLALDWLQQNQSAESNTNA